MSDKKEIVVVSGKGGTGKTTIISCLIAALDSPIIVDADVDAANLYILLKPEGLHGHEFAGKPVAAIDPGKCTSCGLCEQLCRFGAIKATSEGYQVDEVSCDGCGLCHIACPVAAVEMREQIVGQWYDSSTRYGQFIHARLTPGAENSGNLVAKVRSQANLVAKKNGGKLIVIDGPPGIGCPVIAAISGTDLAILVTEPTLSGISDLKRIYELTQHFKIPSGIVINRFDINSDNTRIIEEFADYKGIKIFAKIPHSDCIIREITAANIPSQKCKPLLKEIEKLKTIINQELSAPGMAKEGG